ncbi:MAG: hypothetical protein ACFFDN_36380, partial [Candidatus Hodarchaeota archaeon]
NLSPRLIAWHLKMLEKFDFIRKHKITNKMAFFDSKIKPEFDRAIFTLKEPKNLKILELILLEQGINLGDLVDNSGLKLQNVRNIIKIFIELHLINEKEEHGQIKYFGNVENINPIQKILKIPELEIKPPIIRKVAPPPLAAEQIKILREFDHIGGNIRFKVAVRNETPTTISKLSVMLTPTTQYRIENRIQEIDVLTPGESRGVDFTLIPLTCGKSNVFGTLSYVDTYGKPHSLTIDPKEIWIKCPLVIPQKATKLDIENWKKSLLRGATKIYFSNISNSQAFKIASDQISALDLAEIDINFDQMNAIFSGTAKVTGNTMIVELKIIDSNIAIEVWTSDMKQATGFIAYIKNLVNVALEVAQRLQLKIEKVGQSILDSFDISERLCKCYEICEEREVIHEIILLLGEIISKMERSFPDSSILDEINNSLSELDNFRPGENINEKIAVKLEFSLLQWLKEILKIIQANSKTYQETFTDQEISFKKIDEQIQQLILKVNEIEEQYSINILKYLMVINQASGLTMFNHNFGGFEFDTDLISGFLTAIQSFGTEITKGATPVKKLAYKDFEIVMEDGNHVRAAIVLLGPVTSFLSTKLLKFISIFESNYEKDIKDWTGNITLFKDMSSKVNEIFKRN